MGGCVILKISQWWKQEDRLRWKLKNEDRRLYIDIIGSFTAKRGCQGVNCTSR